MCNKTKEVRLCKCREFSKRVTVGVDACIADIVQALNDAGIETAGCCCGHGNGDGSIILGDGRVLIIKQLND